ncbi:hypothetical protein [Endozoicomonas sp. GU-1]|uniref:hypothetical protein n=1 Tax=Endozoicomonas sp. GU-1 TaxID=3009078 RepID=UPI0022B40434|nr:hypothetical protein [Endozoicomonas sp. GU-1]WBA83839.1 hypothetical protein O2T12_12330 [Endozoicomonas sp. GU-1]WBA86818.1 hypothetical protein O3276_01885 [Endozoicomonas sp. GU-1]
MVNSHFPINTTLSHMPELPSSNSQLYTKPPIAFNLSIKHLDIDEPYLGKMDDEFCDDLNHLDDEEFCSKYLNVEPSRAESLFGRAIRTIKEYVYPSPREKRALSDPPDKARPSGVETDQLSSEAQIKLPCQHKADNETIMVLADYHTNKQIQSVHIKVNCSWHPHTITRTHIVNNGYELRNPDNSAPCDTASCRPGFGAGPRPLVGGSPIDNLHYYEWQLLTARIAGLDGFVVEWGFPARQTSPDKAIVNMKTVLADKNRGNEFALVPLWIPQWTVKASVNLSPEQKEAQFKEKLEEMIQRYYQDEHCIHHRGDPLMFMLNFWGKVRSDLTLNQNELEQFFKNNTELAKVRLVYTMSGKSAWKAATVKQVVSNYPWVVPRRQMAKDSENPFIANNFVRYGTHRNIRHYVNNLDDRHQRSQDHLGIKTMPVYPGVDTRGAPWSPCDSYLPETENGDNTYELSWNQVRKKKPDLVIVETFNDFSEGTHIEPTSSDLGQRVVTTAKQVCLLKGQKAAQCNAIASRAPKLIRQAARLYDARMMMDKLGRVLDEHTLANATKSLNRWANSLFNKKAHKIDRHAAQFDSDFDKLPFKTLVTVMNQEKRNLPTLRRLDGQSSFELISAPIPYTEHCFCEAELKLRIRTENGLPSRIGLSTKVYDDKYDWEYEPIAEIYTPYDQLESTVTIPMTALTGKLRGNLTEAYAISHPPSGCTVELLEIRIKTHHRPEDQIKD